MLPNLDDGVRSIESALQVAREASAQGIEAIAATPHVRPDYPTTAEQMEQGVAALRAELAAAGIPLELLHGAEISLDSLGGLGRAELRRLTLAQRDRHLLLEFPYSGWPLGIEAIVAGLAEQGLTAILAHPERNPQVQEDPGRLLGAVEAGALVQVTAASVVGVLGRNARRASERLLKLGLVDLLASDTHGPGTRSSLAAAAAALGDSRLARRLTHDAPRAIATGVALAS